jgi:tetratricopeptide (TPR) repeat protein
MLAHRMTSNPVIFISAATRELASARELVAKELLALGCQPMWQDAEPTGAGDLRGVLGRWIDDSSGVIQLVGQCYGFEPALPDPDFGRVSYTQYEACYCRQKGKKIWYLLLNENYPQDKHDPESDELRELQAAYRDRVKRDCHVRHGIDSPLHLKYTVCRMRDDLAVLRRRWLVWLGSMLLLIVVVVCGVALNLWGTWWIVDGQHRQEAHLQTITNRQDKLSQAFHDPAVFRRNAQFGEFVVERDRAYADLETKLGITNGTLKRELPAYAARVIASANASPRNLAIALYVRGRYSESETNAVVAWKQSGASQKEGITALEIAGWAAERQTQANRLERAREHFREAEKLTSRERDPLEWARIQHAIAYVQNDHREAALLLREVLSVRKAKSGTNDPATLASWMNLAVALNNQGLYEAAEAEHRAVLAVRERVLGDDDLDTLTSQNNLANTLRKFGELLRKSGDINEAANKLKEAEEIHRAVWQARERLLEPEDRATLGARNNLAETWRAQGHYPEAEQEHRLVWQIRARRLGPRHRETLQSRNNMAEAIGGQRGRYDEAEREHRIVLEQREQALPRKDHEIFESCRNLALVLEKQSKFEEAKLLAKRAHDGFKDEAKGDEANLDVEECRDLLERLEAAK